MRLPLLDPWPKSGVWRRGRPDVRSCGRSRRRRRVRGRSVVHRQDARSPLPFWMFLESDASEAPIYTNGSLCLIRRNVGPNLLSLVWIL